MSDEAIEAGELQASHVGSIVRFRQWDPSKQVATIITGELRQVGHDGEYTTVYYGNLSSCSKSLAHDQTVVLNPSPEYNDVVHLLVDDEADGKDIG